MHKEVTISEYLEHRFSDQEMKIIARDLAQANQALAAIEARKASAMAAFKSQIAIEVEKIALKSTLYNSGSEMRMIECRVLYDLPDVNIKTIIRKDTGEIVRETRMDADEVKKHRQKVLPLEPEKPNGAELDMGADGFKANYYGGGVADIEIYVEEHEQGFTWRVKGRAVFGDIFIPPSNTDFYKERKWALSDAAERVFKWAERPSGNTGPDDEQWRKDAHGIQEWVARYIIRPEVAEDTPQETIRFSQGGVSVSILLGAYGPGVTWGVMGKADFGDISIVPSFDTFRPTRVLALSDAAQRVFEWAEMQDNFDHPEAEQWKTQSIAIREWAAQYILPAVVVEETRAEEGPALASASVMVERKKRKSKTRQPEDAAAEESAEEPAVAEEPVSA